MDLISIISAIADTGFMVVASGVVIWLFLRYNKRSERREEQFQKSQDDRERRSEEAKIENAKIYAEERRLEFANQREAFKSMLSALGEQLKIISKNNRGEHSAEEDAFEEKINKSINDILKSLRESTESCRTMLIRYHNGHYDLTGNPAIKMSATNEAVAIGMQPFMPFFQNQFRGLLSYFCSTVRDKGFIYIEDINSLKDIGENSTYEFLNSRGIKSSYARAVYDGKKNVVGFIVVEYLNKVPVSLEEIDHCLNDKSNKVSALLSLNQESN